MDGKPFRVGSLFSGIEGFGFGFELAGATIAWTSEIDKWASRVIQKRFGTRNVGDITACDPASLDDVDCITFGFPCQDLSVAGHREGLSGARSGLFWEALRVIAAKRPRWIVAENVPGLLSSNQGMDFAVVLWALAALGYGVAYAELDSRYYGVPQRRRRIFIVGYQGEARRAREVLADAKGGYRNPAAGAGAESGVAGEVDGGLDDARIAGTLGGHHARNAPDDNLVGVARPLYYSHDYSHQRIYDGDGGAVPAVTVGKREIFGTLTGSRKGVDSSDAKGNVFGTLRSNPRNNSNPASDPIIWDALTARTGKGPDSDGRGIGDDAAPNPFGGNLAHTLRGEGADASEDGTGRGTPIVFDTRQDPINGDHASALGGNIRLGVLERRPPTAPPDTPRDGTPSGLPRWLDLPMWQGPTEPWRVFLDGSAASPHRREESRQGNRVGERGAVDGGSGAVAGRLVDPGTERERESRNGPNPHDRDRDGREGSRCDCADTPRYRCTGNAVSLPVAYSLACRIREVDAR